MSLSPVGAKILLSLIDLLLTPFVRYFTMTTSRSCDLVLDSDGMIIETSMRIWDHRSLHVALICLDHKVFGQLSRSKYKVRMDGEIVPLLVKRRNKDFYSSHTDSSIHGVFDIRGKMRMLKPASGSWEVNPAVVSFLHLP